MPQNDDHDLNWELSRDFDRSGPYRSAPVKSDRLKKRRARMRRRLGRLFRARHGTMALMLGYLLIVSLSCNYILWTCFSDVLPQVRKYEANMDHENGLLRNALRGCKGA